MAPTLTALLFAGVGSGISYAQGTMDFSEAQTLMGTFKCADLCWHTFRHTYRSWLDETGAPMKVQQELMRHASIQTTMNVYGQAMSSSKREANGKVVEMVLKPMKASA